MDIEPQPAPLSDNPRTDENVDPAEEEEYCRFGKRDLEKMSWVAPLVNNRLGDLLNLELRHEQLFFIRGNKVLDNIGYSEKGTRFNEADFGKPIETLDDAHRQGYWLVGRTYSPEVMREALDRQDDGHYYSVFSNQCQDWADRLKRQAARIEKEWGREKQDRRAPDEKRAPPTEPASVGMGIIALVLGIGAILAPIFAGRFYALILGLAFVAIGISHFLYAFAGKDVRAGVPIFATGLLNLVGGLFLVFYAQAGMMIVSLVVAIIMGIEGLAKVSLALFNRPLRNWLGHLATGLLLLLLALFIALGWPDRGQRFLGAVVGIALITGGLSSIFLSRRTRNDVE